MHQEHYITIFLFRFHSGVDSCQHSTLLELHLGCLILALFTSHLFELHPNFYLGSIPELFASDSQWKVIYKALPVRLLQYARHSFLPSVIVHATLPQRSW